MEVYRLCVHWALWYFHSIYRASTSALKSKKVSKSFILQYGTFKAETHEMPSVVFLLMNISILNYFYYYSEVKASLVKKCVRKADCYWTDLACLLLQCMSIRRQSTVHSAAAFPLNCNSQAKVAAWLQSSDDMDKCSKGERTEFIQNPFLWTHLNLRSDTRKFTPSWQIRTFPSEIQQKSLENGITLE